MKFTNRGRQIKDNSRRTGAGAARVTARKESALQRFRIMPFGMWLDSNHLAKRAWDKTEEKELYNAYVARRNVELDALKRSLKVA